MQFSITVSCSTEQELWEAVRRLTDSAQAVVVTMPSVSSMVVPPPSAPPAVETPEVPESAPPAVVGNTDEWGVVWDPSIHNSNRKLYASGEDHGKWMRRRGLPEEMYNALYVGKSRLGSPPPPAASTSATPPPPAPTSASATPPPPPATVTTSAGTTLDIPTLGGVGAAPQMRDVSNVLKFPDLCRYVNELNSRPDAATFNARISQLFAELGYPKGLPEIAAKSVHDASVIPTVALSLAQLEVMPV